MDHERVYMGIVVEYRARNTGGEFDAFVDAQVQ